MTDVLISLRNICKSFDSDIKKIDVLKQINLNVHRGESISVVGKSGSGKSTLLSIIGLLESSSSGEYQLCGSNIKTLSHHQLSILRNRHLGWVFQNFHLVADLTVAKNIALPLRYNSTIPSSQYRDLVQQQLERVGLLDKADSYPAQLSGGQQQRVAIARALITAPDILLCDEPTGNLDSHNSDNIMSLLLDLNKGGTTLLLVTHDQQLADLCCRKIRLVDGAIDD